MSHFGKLGNKVKVRVESIKRQAKELLIKTFSKRVNIGATKQTFVEYLNISNNKNVNSKNQFIARFKNKIKTKTISKHQTQ